MKIGVCMKQVPAKDAPLYPERKRGMRRDN